MQAQRGKRARGRGALGGFAARAQRGLTLAELMVVVAVSGILLGIGIPSFQGLMAQNRATSAANQLQSSLQFARSTAVAQGRTVTVCVADFTTTPASCIVNNNVVRNWQVGWIVRLDNPDLTPAERVLREQRPLNPSITLTGWPELRYSNTGTLATGQTLVDFELSTASRSEANRMICMSLSGSSRIIQGDPPCPR
jgi:type IV fimbrial biogenesis protein FimT